MDSHSNRQRGGKAGVRASRSSDTTIQCDAPRLLRLPVSLSGAKGGLGLCLTLQILCARSEAHLKFSITVGSPCGEHLAGWHTFWNAEFHFEDEESLLTGQLKIHHTHIWKLCGSRHFFGSKTILLCSISQFSTFRSVKEKEQQAASGGKAPRYRQQGPPVGQLFHQVAGWVSVLLFLSSGVCTHTAGKR